MSRRKKTEEEHIKQFLATADVPTLNRFRELADFAIMSKGGEPPLVKRATHRKAKDAQIPLVKGEAQ